jgi:hypothetical protein
MAEEYQNKKTFVFQNWFIGRDWHESRFIWAVTMAINEPLDYTTIPSLGHSSGVIMKWIHTTFGPEAVGCILPLFLAS